MLEASRGLAGGAVLLLILAGAAWVYPLARPQLRRLNGGVTDTGHHQRSALLLLAAFGISAVAAFLAIAKWSLS
jgi:hypothetical protein